MSARASLRGRATAVLAVLALLLSTGAVSTLLALQRLGGAVDTILRENYASVRACERMSDALERADSAVLVQTLEGATAARAAAEVPALRGEFERALRFEESNVTLPGEGPLVQRLRAAWGEYVHALEAARSARGLTARREVYEHEILPRTERLRALLGEILALNHARMEQADRDARAIARRSVRLAGVFGALATALALGALYALPRSFVRPIEALAGTARAFGAGDFSHPLAPPLLVELDPLADALRAAAAQLRAYRESSLGELLAARDLAQSTVECLLDPVLVLGPDGAVLLANEACERAFGVRAGSVDELRAAALEVPEPLRRASARVRETRAPFRVQNLSDAFAFVAAGEGERGASPRYYLLRAAPLSAQHDARDAGRVLVVAEDVTRLRRIDDLKSDRVATVSHEFKTPLTSLRMATHLMLEPATGALNDSQRELCVTARDETERLRAMVDALLDLVRIESEAGALRVAEVDAVALLREAEAAHRAIARERGVTLRVEADEAVRVCFEGDAEKLAIVLANLTANALRHTPEGGTVTLSCARSERDALQVPAVTLAVRDDGEGIDRASLETLFARRVAGPGGAGSRDRHGLGLSIAREIVLQHGGDLRVESARGAGSTFVVALPEHGAGGYTSRR